MRFRIDALGERALCLRWDQRIDAATNREVHRAAAWLGRAAIESVVDLVPAYASLAVVLDSDACAADPALIDRVRTTIVALLQRAGESGDDDLPLARGLPAQGRTIEVPVCYAGGFGIDLDTVAERAGLTCEAVIALHCAPTYQVAMLGFAPGFAYLLGLDPRLHTPRRAEPRIAVPAGSVGIAGAQTGIYPQRSPGGWQLIGRCPWRLFDPRRAPPSRLQPGDRVRFQPIDAEAYGRLCEHGGRER